jgi:lysozyme family protein
VDFGVNSGPHTAVAWLQKSLGVTPDGVIGLKTLGALDTADVSRVYLKLCAGRMRFLGRLITNNPSQAVFAAGWMDRVASFVES